MIGKLIPNLTRTAQALKVYDTFHEGFNQRVVAMSNEQASREFDELCRLELLVGQAFVQDTADRNSPDIANLIQAGPKTAPPGSSQTFVRRMVEIWQQLGVA